QAEDTVDLAGAFFPRFQGHKRHARALSATCKVEAADTEYRLDNIAFLIEQVITYLVHDLLGPSHARARRCLYLRIERALVFLGQECAGNTAKHPGNDAQNQCVKNEIRQLVFEDTDDAALITAYTALEGFVEPAKEAALAVDLAVFDRFEQ